MTNIPSEVCEFACIACGAGAEDIKYLGKSPDGCMVYKCNDCNYVWTVKETEGDDN